MKLNEILDKPIELKIIRDTDRAYQADAEINGRIIRFKFNKRPNENTWGFTFVELSDFDNPYGPYETYKATGNGGQIAVFATAKKFLEDAIKKHSPDAVYFEADKTRGASRSKLYNRFVTRWHPVGYTHEIVEPNDHVDYHAFVKDSK